MYSARDVPFYTLNSTSCQFGAGVEEQYVDWWHDCELVDQWSRRRSGGSITTSKLATASSDGKVNYWSVSSLLEPVEHVQVNANLSCLEKMHGGSN